MRPTLTRIDEARFQRVASRCQWSERSLGVVHALLVEGRQLAEVAAAFDMRPQNANTLRSRFIKKVEKDRLAEFIRSEPPSSILALRERDTEIRTLQAKGYSVEQILTYLMEGGAAVSESTLRNYLEGRPGMKTIVMANQKGGVGKSAVAVQLAYYLQLIVGKRVLVIDFDHQRNSSKALRTGGIATVSQIPASRVLTAKVKGVEDEPFVLLAADNAELLGMEVQGKQAHNLFASNLQAFLKAVDADFDVCIIDTNPNPDIRQLASLVVADFVLSPIQLNQEAIDGIGDLLNHDSIGIRKIQATINPKLKLIGILPNLVEPTPFQRENLKDLAAAFASLMIATGNGYAAIKKSTAIPEAQAAGIPVWKLGKTSGREAWAQIKPTFEKIASTMGVL
ncbi:MULTISPECIES: ParA family protein [unclassified Rhodanobacter]|uniref:ParA family protein n=1 Tax=Rhodanobacter humi TaxID=1888173 RepID=A0ABV4AW17_9GAMM